MIVSLDVIIALSSIAIILIESIDSKERIVYFKNKEHCYASVRNVKKYNKIIKSVNGVFNCKSCWILTR